MRIPFDLLVEVFNGQYDNFREYLSDHKIKTLDLSEAIINRPLGHLAIALQGTEVSKVVFGPEEAAAALPENLIDMQVISAAEMAEILKGTQVTKVYLSRGNDIGLQGVAGFTANLEGTQVTELDLSHINDMGPNDAAEIASRVPETLLVKVNLSFPSPELSEALNLNRQKLIFTPYYILALKLLSASEKDNYFNLNEQSLESEEGRVRYAGGILMHSDLPEIIQEKILGYFPLMTTQNGVNQAHKYNRVLQEYHSGGVKPERV